MSAKTTEVKAAEARLAQHRDDAGTCNLRHTRHLSSCSLADELRVRPCLHVVHAKLHLAESLDSLKAAQSRLLVKRLDETIKEQRNVEQEALAYSKNVNSLYQRAAKWKAEQKRFRSTLDVRLQ